MQIIQRIATALILLALFGCAGVGIIQSSDPDRKLNDAADLWQRQDRPFPAERLIREAIVIYKERNDFHGLGNAHREYGDMLRSNAVVRHWGNYQDINNNEIAFENRTAKAAEYYLTAMEYYPKAEQQRLDAKQYDKLTNVYYNMAWTSYKLNQDAKACHYFGKVLDAYFENMRQHPDAKPIAQGGTIPELVASDKKRTGCD